MTRTAEQTPSNVPPLRTDLLFDPFDADWRILRAAGLPAVHIGFDGLWTWDHLMGGVHRAWQVLECWTLLTALAAITERVAIRATRTQCRHSKRDNAAVPWLSAFLELNVRTCVTVGGLFGCVLLQSGCRKSGGCCARVSDLQAALFSGPHELLQEGWGVQYTSQRTHSGAPRAELRAWQLQPAQAAFERDTMAASHALRLTPTEPLVHFAGHQDAIVWPPKRVADYSSDRGSNVSRNHA